MLFQLRKPRLFIIEDNLMSRLITSEYIRTHFSYRTSEFGSVEACLSANEPDPHIILLDHDLPGMNGLEAIPVLKSRWPGAQIVIVSGQKDKKVILALLKADIADYIDKANYTAEDLKMSIELAEERFRSKKIRRFD